MASFYDITVGQQVEFQRVLASAGFTDRDIARVIREPKLASMMYASIQPKLVSSMPSWYVSPEQQLARARQLWPNVVLPEPPKEFTPRTKSEVLLLHVPDTFDNLWNLVNAPVGYTKYRAKGVESDKQNLRLAPGKVEFAEPVWLAFDPEHGKDEPPHSFWASSLVEQILAGGEVLSALIQFPEWPLTWPDGASAPMLTGYQLKCEGDWSFTPYVPSLYCEREDGQLTLFRASASNEFLDIASLSIRRVY